MSFKSLMKRFASNDSGQVAVITSIIALPLMLGVSVAVDSHRSDLARAQLQAALDSAALAAVTDQTLTADERSQTADARFWANMSDEENVKFRVVSSDGQKIELEAYMQIPTLFAGVVGREDVTFSGTAAAEIIKGRTVCMLALDPNSARSFEVSEGAMLEANCSVQVNSLNDQASVVQGGGKATAQSFCVGGGSTGEYDPFVNTECGMLGDPYSVIDFPEPDMKCVDQDELNAKLDDWRSTRDAVENHEIYEDNRVAEAERTGEVVYPTYFEKQHLQPGNYCEGLSLNAKEFILDPGVYHITGGGLEFGLGTQLYGEDITFIMHNTTGLDIANGSEINIKGPSDGPLTGLVIAQSLQDKSMLNPKYPNVDSVIRDGSILNIIGTIYLPSHEVSFLGGSRSKTYAPATSFIAHRIVVTDGAIISVAADHVAADSTPIEPRSDDGARLVE